MSDFIVYLDTSEVQHGKLEQLKPAMIDLVRFVQGREPRIIAYNVYLSENDTRMNVLHIHPDSESLGFHLETAGPEFRKFVPLVKLLAIDIYGELDNHLLQKLREKSVLLGTGSVRVHKAHAGFARFLTV